MRILALGAAILLCGCSSSPPEATCEGASFDQQMQLEADNGFVGAVSRDSLQRYRWNSPNIDPERTRFWIGSISKTFAAVTAVKLDSRQALSLDMKVKDVFPEVQSAVGQLTLESLLAHRSGLGDHYAADGIIDADEAARAIAANGIEKTGFSYSNDGFNLAAAMMEKATGKSYEELVRKEILEPLRMENTGFWGDGGDKADFAPYPHKTIANVMRDGRTIRNIGYIGSGGMYSTMADLDRYLKGMTDEKFLTPRESEKLFVSRRSVDPGQSQPDGTTYGLGWALEYDDGRPVEFRHGGYDTTVNHNAKISTSPDGKVRQIIFAADAGDEDYLWSDRINDALADCKAKSVIH